MLCLTSTVFKAIELPVYINWEIQKNNWFSSALDKPSLSPMRVMRHSPTLSLLCYFLTPVNISACYTGMCQLRHSSSQWPCLKMCDGSLNPLLLSAWQPHWGHPHSNRRTSLCLSVPICSVLLGSLLLPRTPQRFNRKGLWDFQVPRNKGTSQVRHVTLLLFERVVLISPLRAGLGASSSFGCIVHSGIIRTQSAVAPSTPFIPQPTRLSACSPQPCIYYLGDDCPPFICDWVLLKEGGFLPKRDACLMNLDAQKLGPHRLPWC